ncbi:hypothetical protein RR48_08352 [Papilio machaon]|uniref:Uncharacterized protein n=1 Tax=Papilio machaon TaxID=76193 RepID=A0A194R2Z0_PAPMA|nr:hypothetical protein RR48_08352 [Papilio machaon]
MPYIDLASKRPMKRGKETSLSLSTLRERERDAQQITVMSMFFREDTSAVPPAVLVHTSASVQAQVSHTTAAPRVAQVSDVTAAPSVPAQVPDWTAAPRVAQVPDMTAAPSVSAQVPEWTAAPRVATAPVYSAAPVSQEHASRSAPVASQSNPYVGEEDLEAKAKRKRLG